MHQAATLGKDNAVKQKSRLGLIMFAIYSAVYVGFVFINTFAPKLMGTVIWSGLNVAVLYGFALIILAIVLGLIYNHLCTKLEDKLGVEEVKS